MPQQTKRPLKVGLFLPTVENFMGGGTARWRDLKAMALHAEAAGFDSVWVNDHLIYEFGGPDEPQHGIWEGWSLLSSLAPSSGAALLGEPWDPEDRRRRH